MEVYMVENVEVPFQDVDDLRKEYGLKFLVLSNCGLINQAPSHKFWDKTGVLRVVCDTYKESLTAAGPLYKDEETYGDVIYYFFPGGRYAN
jgi:hypothetical protein